ncbi:efflux RND transporter periplasmic adaptor subunit [bacterium]|nr:efflux RND transporter periplasmic adaptor subunit [bacterium]
MWRKILLFAFIPSLITSSIFFLSGEEKKGSKKIDQNQLKVVGAEGRVTVKPDRRAVLAAEVAGRVDKIFVDNLMHVKKGQLLAMLYNADLEDRIRETEARFNKARASYLELANGSRREDVQEAAAHMRRADAALELAQRNEARDKQLFDEGVIARSRYDVTAAELKQAQADREAAAERFAKMSAGERDEIIDANHAEMIAQKYALESLKATHEKTLIRSPLDGIVIMRYRNVSEFADIGQPVLEVADLSEMIVEGEVNEMDAGRVRDGQKVIVLSDAYPGKKFHGELYEVSVTVKRRQEDPEDPSVIIDQKVLPVKVRFLERVPLRLGMKVDLKIGDRGLYPNVALVNMEVE